jgi:hypothetical protein
MDSVGGKCPHTASRLNGQHQGIDGRPERKSAVPNPPGLPSLQPRTAEPVTQGPTGVVARGDPRARSTAGNS